MDSKIDDENNDSSSKQMDPKIDDDNNDSSSEQMPPSSSRKVMKVKDNGQLPWDVLGTIAKKLDFDDLFQFARVCKDWRGFHKTYWKNFMASQSPLLIQTSSYAKKTYFFFSLSEQKIYSSNLGYFWGLSFVGFSSGYVIMAGYNHNRVVLMNPFTRRKKEISTEMLLCHLIPMSCHAYLAFSKGNSEEFILALLCELTKSLHVYQSRKTCWVTYSRCSHPWRAVDLVILHQRVYVITDEAKIGIMKLDGTVEFLELNNTPTFSFINHKLVNSDGNLLVLHFDNHEQMYAVYKIDFSRMEWVKVEELGDVALFVSMRRKCYALSNPGKWGYDKECVYYINSVSAECKVYSLKRELINNFDPTFQAPRRSKLYWLDWCFLHVRDEIDY